MLKTFTKLKSGSPTSYALIFMAIILGVILSSVISGISSYKTFSASNKKVFEEKLKLTENIIFEAINEHSWQISSIADKIMKANGDLDSVSRIITNYNKLDTKSNFDQFLNQKDLFWVDKNDYVVIKNKIGILHYPKRISENYDVASAKKNSWKLIISPGSPYYSNDYNLILTSFGVTDKNGDYLGSIVSSIDISMIQNLLERGLVSFKKEIGVIVLNKYNNKIIFRSDSRNIHDSKNHFVNKKDVVVYRDSVMAGKLEEDIIFGEMVYKGYHKVRDYPFVVLYGYNPMLQKMQLLGVLLKTAYPNIVIIGVLSFLAFILFYQKVVQPINRLSRMAARINNDNNPKFLSKFDSPGIFSLAKALTKIKIQRERLEESNLSLIETKIQLEDAIETIKKSDIAQIEIVRQIKKGIAKKTAQAFQVLNMLRHNLSANNLPESNINLFLIKSLEQDLSNITKFATDELSKEFVEVRSLISRAILSREKEIKIRNIKLEVSYNNNLPKKIFVDQIRLIQILSSILYKTIVLLSDGNVVRILVRTVIRNKKKNLMIKIEDNGLGIGFKEYERDKKRIGGNEEGSINGIDISVGTIEELVSLHQGQIIYNDIIQQGASTVIILPCGQKNEKNSSDEKGKIGTKNVIFFPKRKD